MGPFIELRLGPFLNLPPLTIAQRVVSSHDPVALCLATFPLLGYLLGRRVTQIIDVYKIQMLGFIFIMII